MKKVELLWGELHLVRQGKQERSIMKLDSLRGLRGADVFPLQTEGSFTTSQVSQRTCCSFGRTNRAVVQQLQEWLDTTCINDWVAVVSHQ